MLLLLGVSPGMQNEAKSKSEEEDYGLFYLQYEYEYMNEYGKLAYDTIPANYQKVWDGTVIRIKVDILKELSPIVR